VTAKDLLDLHVPGRPLLLPNAWDADTAKLVVDAGFPVVATSSAAVAAVLGYDDGEEASVGEMFAAAARISAVISVPLTVDAESGYGLAPGELVDRLFEVDAVGCNLEDTDQQAGQRRGGSEQAALLAAVRERAGDGLVINARIDSFLGTDDHRAALPDALARARSYLDAGADCLYPIFLKSPELLAEFVEAVAPAPVNVSYLPGGPDLAELAELGVARISLGAGLWRASQHWLKGALQGIAAGKPPY
jgi:2-methylisocitrate lyase-like PEP mutase family enzyme